MITKNKTNQKNAENRILDSEARYRKLVEYLPEGIVVHCDGEIVYANPAAKRMVKEEQLMGNSIVKFLHPDFQKFSTERLSDITLNEELPVMEMKFICKDGQIIDVEVSSMSLLYDGSPSIMTLFRDITDRKQAERDLQESQEALQNSEEKYRLIADHSQDMIKLVDAHGLILYASPSHPIHFGFAAEEYTGKHITEGIHPDDIQSFHEQLYHCIKDHEAFTIELRRQHKNGQWIWVESNGTLVLDEKGYIKHMVFTTRNIMERKQYEEKLEFLAFHDPLTGLPNRRSFIRSLEQAIMEAERDQRKLAVLFMDLDRFKSINDTWGHDAGDELLIQFSQRLRRCLGDDVIVSRLGGDEFTILLPKIQDDGDAILAAEKIINALQEPWQVGEHTFRTTSSIGISVFPRDGQDPDPLLKNADIALYQAKEQGRNHYQMFVHR